MQHDPATIAYNLIRMGVRDPAATLRQYLDNAADMQADAAKADAAKRGKYRGYTGEEYRQQAKEHTEIGFRVSHEMEQIFMRGE